MKIAPEIERKFLVRDAKLQDVEDLSLSEVHSVYLDATRLVKDAPEHVPKELMGNVATLEARVAHRITDGETKFSMTLKTGGAELERLEAKEKIKEKDFDQLRKEFGIHEIRKKRFMFDYLRKTFELEVIPDLQIMLMEVEFEPSENTMVALPPFVEVIKEVTGDPKYYSGNMAKHVSLMNKGKSSKDV